MKKHMRKEQITRTFFSKNELNVFVLKSLIKNENLSLIIKWNAVIQLASFSKKLNKIRLVNRCVLTTRKAKFNRTFKKFSRLSFLRLARTGMVPGLKKSSW